MFLTSFSRENIVALLFLSCKNETRNQNSDSFDFLVICCLVQYKGSCRSVAGQSGVGGKLMHVGILELRPYRAGFYHK